jgi:hypothetical protein
MYIVAQYLLAKPEQEVFGTFTFYPLINVTKAYWHATITVLRSLSLSLSLFQTI